MRPLEALEERVGESIRYFQFIFLGWGVFFSKSSLVGPTRGVTVKKNHINSQVGEILYYKNTHS